VSPFDPAQREVTCRSPKRGRRGPPARVNGCHAAFSLAWIS